MNLSGWKLRGAVEFTFQPGTVILGTAHSPANGSISLRTCPPFVFAPLVRKVAKVISFKETTLEISILSEQRSNLSINQTK